MDMRNEPRKRENLTTACNKDNLWVGSLVMIVELGMALSEDKKILKYWV